MFNLQEVFNKRAEQLTDHDPWRYGSDLSLKADLVELEWIFRNKEHGDLLDVGCGTGRHCIELAKRHGESRFDCFDFASNNIKILSQKVSDIGLTNVHAEICSTDEMYDVYREKRYSNILSIGLVQYLDEQKLTKHISECYDLLLDCGVLMVKHPTSYAETFIFDGYSELLASRYVSIYRNFPDLIGFFHTHFYIEKVEPVFTLNELTQQEMDKIEQNTKTRQLWFLFRKRDKPLNSTHSI